MKAYLIIIMIIMLEKLSKKVHNIKCVQLLDNSIFKKNNLK